MSNTIQPINPSQNAQMVNSHQDKQPQPKPAEKPPERPEPTTHDRPERAEARKASPPRAEANPAEENRVREKQPEENPNPQEVQNNNQANKQSGKTLDIMA